MKTSFYKRKDIVIILSILAFSLLVLIILYVGSKKSDGNKATITIDNKIIKTISLNNEKNQRFYIEQAEVWFEIRDNKISFVDVTCPDKICQNTGYIYMAGQTAVCMPKHVILTISADDSETDAVVN